MAKPMVVDFTVVVRSEASAANVAHAVAQAGYQSKVGGDAAEWLCTCSCSMILTCASVVAAQAQLNSLAAPFGGVTDGWGTFGNV